MAVPAGLFRYPSFTQWKDIFHMLDAIKKAIHDAALGNQKMAMFHFQVLKNAAALEDIEPLSFCDQVGVPKTYQTEFRKMLSLARVIRQQGLRLG